MRWEDERYVRLYIRDTADWLSLSFDAQALWSMLLRRFDRIGNIELGRRGASAVAALVGHPGEAERISKALTELLEDGCLELLDDGRRIYSRNFLAAQETPKSPAERQKEKRQRDAEAASVTDPSRDVTRRHAVSRDVTPSHAPSRNVTPSVCTVPSVPPVLSVPLTTAPAVADAAVQGALPGVEEKPTRRAPKEKPTDDRHAPLVKALCDAYERITGIRYKWQGGKDAAALSGLLAHEGPERIREVWEFGVAADPGEWASCRTVAALASKWNDLAAKMPPPSAAVPPCSRVGCDRDGTVTFSEAGPPLCQTHYYAELSAWKGQQPAGVAS